MESQPLEHIAERAFLYYREDQVHTPPESNLSFEYAALILSLFITPCIFGTIGARNGYVNGNLAGH